MHLLLGRWIFVTQRTREKVEKAVGSKTKTHLKSTKKKEKYTSVWEDIQQYDIGCCVPGMTL